MKKPNNNTYEIKSRHLSHYQKINANNVESAILKYCKTYSLFPAIPLPLHVKKIGHFIIDTQENKLIIEEV